MAKSLIHLLYPVDFSNFFRTTFLRKTSHGYKPVEKTKKNIASKNMILHYKLNTERNATISSIQEYHSQHLLVQSELWKHQNNV